MRYISKLIFAFLVIIYCVDVTFAMTSEVGSFTNFLTLDYSDKNAEELLKNKENIKNIEEEILNEFLRFVKYDDDDPNFSKDIDKNKDKIDLDDEIKTYLSMTPKNCLRELVEKNLRTILETRSGKYLILRLIHLLNRKKESAAPVFVSFQRVEFGSGVLQLKGKISIDLEHLLTSTDFFILNEAGNGTKKEGEPRPDVYIFHELLHVYHYCSDQHEFNKLSIGRKKESLVYKVLDDEAVLSRCFPNDLDEDKVDYEEMRTIVGVPYKENEAIIICENSYRLEKGIPLRINLLDGATEKDDPEDYSVILSVINEVMPLYVH